MTNEFKARVIAQTNSPIWSNKNIFEECYQSAMQMAEWKDSLIIDELNKQIDRANKYYDNKLSHNEILKSIGAITSLVNLLNIEFPYDRLHMGFATLD